MDTHFWGHGKRRCAAAALALLGFCAGAGAVPVPQRIELPAQAPGGVLQAHWLPAVGSERRPAVLALHGCGGLYTQAGKLAQRYRETAQRLHAAGVAVLMPDSFGSRGVTEVCQTRYRERGVDVQQRAGDARAALAWLAAQPQVDPRHIAVLGWSNGGSTTLELLATRRVHPMVGEPSIAGAAVFYPGCSPLLRRKAALEPVPLLLLLGALDDWTPPAPCEELARTLQAHPGSDVAVKVFDGSYHGFDGTAPVRLRIDVPNGTSSKGVHQGANPQARAESLALLNTFLSRVLATRMAP